MKKLLLSITLCATLLATGHQAQAEEHYGKICLISALIASSCGAGALYYSNQEAALAEQLDDLDPEELSELEAEISKFKTRKYVLWGAAGISAVVAGVSGYKKFQNRDPKSKKKIDLSFEIKEEIIKLKEQEFNLKCDQTTIDVYELSKKGGFGWNDSDQKLLDKAIEKKEKALIEIAKTRKTVSEKITAYRDMPGEKIDAFEEEINDYINIE